MITIEFNLNQDITKIQANTDNFFQEIKNKFCQKSLIKPESAYFYANGKLLNDEQTVGQQMTQLNKQNNKLIVLVNLIESIENREEVIEKSKDIICPNCHEPCRIKIENFKVDLFGCPGNHNISNINIEDYLNTQKINISKLICEKCINKNKGNTPVGEFYRCLTCKKNLCLLCKTNHDTNHNIIKYDQKNYICQKHNENFIKYCKKCNLNICFSCLDEHQEHELISFEELKPNVEEAKNLLDDMKKEIDTYNDKKKVIIDKLNELSEKLDSFYNINNDIINNYDPKKKNRNYQILKNIREININNEKTKNLILGGVENIYKLLDINFKNKENNIKDNLTTEKDMKKMFKFEIPGIEPIFNNILISTREYILDNYRNNENDMRYSIDDREINEFKNKYVENLRILDNSMFNLINKEEGLKTIIKNFENEKEGSQLDNLLINDYYLFFLINHFCVIKNKEKKEKILNIENIDDARKFMNLMVEMRKNIIDSYNEKTNVKNNYLYELARTIIWIESYNEEIFSLEKLFLKLNKKIPKFYEQINEIISSNQIQYEIPGKNSDYTFIVNKVFLLCLDSILKIITTKPDIYELSATELFELININNEVLIISLGLESNLLFKSKNINLLKQSMKIIDALKLNNLASVENVKKTIQYLTEEINSIKEGSKEKLCFIFVEYYKYLEILLENIPSKKGFDYYKFISIFLFEEFIKVDYIEFRELILKKILEKNNLIKNSSQIVNLILEKAGINCYPELIEANINNIKNEDSQLFSMLNKTNNAFLEEVIMNIYERKIKKYFELIPDLENEKLEKLYKIYFKQNKKRPNKTGIVFDISFDIFKQTINFLDSITQTNQNNIKEKNINLLKLYSIVYVKIYLYYLTSFIVKDYHRMDNIEYIINYINDINNKEFSKVIKIYFLKLIFNFSDRNFEEFKSFPFEIYGINFYKEFVGNIKENNTILTYHILPQDTIDFDKYLQVLNEYNKNPTFNINNRNMEIFIDKNGIDLFLIMIINKIISNYPLSDNNANENTYKNLSEYSKIIFNYEKKKKYNKYLSELLSLFFDYEKYNKLIKPKISDYKDKIDIKTFEALLYGFRFCVNSLIFDKEDNADIKKFTFPSLLTENYQKTIESSFILGFYEKEDLHISHLELINYHFEHYSDMFGCYVCSCGFYYCLHPSGFPTKNIYFSCPNCGLRCGGGPKVIKDKGPKYHGMAVRPGHYRIFKDQAQKERQMSKWNDPDENIPNMTLEKYIKEVITPIQKKNPNTLIKKTKEISKIGYMILNFISFIHLFFSYCLGYLPSGHFGRFWSLDSDPAAWTIFKANWDSLEELLHKHNIDSIQIFLNMIFKNLSNIIKIFPITEKETEKENFENIIEELISKSLLKYPEYSKKYKEKIIKVLDLDIKSLRTYLTELIPPNSENYSENEYPLFKYFNHTNYKSKEDMIKKIDNKKKYPLINRLIIDKSNLIKLENLPAFNEFTNYLVKYYSFKISRKDAENITLKNEHIFKEKEFSQKYQNFLKSWNNIKSDAIKYKCFEMYLEHEYTENDKVNNFLNDNGVLYGGMYIASACQNFIDWQNTFLQPIVDENKNGGILHYYINNISKRIPLQDAKRDQILLIKERFHKSRTYVDFNDIIYAFSARNIFGENGEINYSNYNNFTYDLDKIEEELGKIILPGVHLFKGEDNLNFIHYLGEGFRGVNSVIITQFYNKYIQHNLDKNEQNDIIKYILFMNKTNLEKSGRKYDFTKFLGSLQILLFYLTNSVILNEDKKIGNIIENLPKNYIISEDCKNFFLKEGKNYSLDKFMNIFSYFEHLFFDEFCQNLQPEYKKDIEKDIELKILEKLLKTKDDDIITIKDLAAAVRRFISRYLAGGLSVIDINEFRDLAFELCRRELWQEKIRNLNNLDDLISNKLNEFKLAVGQAYKFYEIIGDEDKKFLEQ